MSSGKIFAMVLEADGVIAKWRDIHGRDDPKKAAPGTISARPGTSIRQQLRAWLRCRPETAAY